jgi:hypothetical protein
LHSHTQDCQCGCKYCPPPTPHWDGAGGNRVHGSKGRAPKAWRSGYCHRKPRSMRGTTEPHQGHTNPINPCSCWQTWCCISYVCACTGCYAPCCHHLSSHTSYYLAAQLTGTTQPQRRLPHVTTSGTLLQNMSALYSSTAEQRLLGRAPGGEGGGGGAPLTRPSGHHRPSGYTKRG